MSGILTKSGHKSIIVNGVEDHVHIFAGLNPNISISKMAYDVKRSSSLFINNQNLTKGYFRWQAGYGAFTYARSQLETVYHYIENQEQHHRKKTFRDAYAELLKKFEIDYDERYLFDFVL